MLSVENRKEGIRYANRNPERSTTWQAVFAHHQKQQGLLRTRVSKFSLMYYIPLIVWAVGETWRCFL